MKVFKEGRITKEEPREKPFFLKDAGGWGCA